VVAAAVLTQLVELAELVAVPTVVVATLLAVHLLQQILVAVEAVHEVIITTAVMAVQVL
jgi:hypothetical protein